MINTESALTKHLSEILSVYDRIARERKQYEAALTRMEEISNIRRERTLHIRIRLMGMVFIGCAAVVPVCIFCGFGWRIAAVGIMAICVGIYGTFRLREVYREYETTCAEAENALLEAYEALIQQEYVITQLTDGMDKSCIAPLSVYIMRCAAAEGRCRTIPEAQL